MAKSWTKRQIVNEALEEIGISAYDFDSTPQDLQTALRRLDSMMIIWTDLGIVFTPDAYPYSTDPSLSDLDQDTNAPGEAIEPMCLNLAIRIAPAYGKTVSQQTKLNASTGFNNLLGNYVGVEEQDLGNFLLGAGAKRSIYPWNYDILVPDAGEVIPVPPPDVINFRITEEGNQRITEEGDDRILE